jgi:hypothetical protein
VAAVNMMAQLALEKHLIKNVSCVLLITTKRKVMYISIMSNLRIWKISMQSFFKPPSSEVKEEVKSSPAKREIGVHYLSYNYQNYFLRIRPYFPKEECDKYCAFLRENPQEQTNRSLINFVTKQLEFWMNKKLLKDYSGCWDVNALIDTLTKTIHTLKTALDTSYYEAHIPIKVFEKEFKSNTVYFNRQNVAIGLAYAAAGLITMGDTLKDAAKSFGSAAEYGYAGKINIPREWIKGQIDPSKEKWIQQSRYYKPQDDYKIVYFAHCRRPEEVLTLGTQYIMHPDVNGKQHASILVFDSCQNLLSYTKARESDHYRNEYGERKHSKWTAAQLSALDITLDPEALMAHHSKQSRDRVAKWVQSSKEDEIERRPLLGRN